MADPNSDATERLRALLTRLDDSDLSRDLGAGWSVTTALAHLAFWDRQQALTLAAWPERDGPIPQDDAVNEALEPILSAVAPRAAADLALESAAALDAAIAGASDELVSEIRARGHGYIVERAPHRLEHLEQIERAIAGRAV